MTNRIALVIQYDGSGFRGWQNQKDSITVQGTLEDKITELDPIRPVKVIAAGRTDSGVHASGQVVHFDCSGNIPANRWPSALNGRLVKTIRVRDSLLRPHNWHACHSAIFRRYRYTIYNGCKPNLFLEPWSWHRYRFRLDDSLMQLALKDLIGLHDFSAFQKAGSRRAHSWTTIQDLKLERQGDLVTLEIQASGFLYGMVRLLMGQLVSLGEHRISLKVFKKRWQEGLRSEVRESAPSKGLCLIQVGYKELVFPKPQFSDSFPRFLLINQDPPASPL